MLLSILHSADAANDTGDSHLAKTFILIEKQFPNFSKTAVHSPINANYQQSIKINDNQRKSMKLKKM